MQNNEWPLIPSKLLEQGFDKNDEINWENVITELNKTMKKRPRIYVKKTTLEDNAKALNSLPESDPELERIKTAQEIELKEQLEEQLEDLEKNQPIVNPNELPMGEGEAYGKDQPSSDNN